MNRLLLKDFLKEKAKTLFLAILSRKCAKREEIVDKKRDTHDKNGVNRCFCHCNVVHTYMEETTMTFHSSVIFVNDIEQSKDFYVRLLNQTIEHDFGKNVILQGGLTIWEIQQEHVICQQLDRKNTSNRFELYFEDEFIDRVREILLQENVEFLHEIHEEPWGQRTIRFFDPDRHLIEIGEPLKTFVNNMKMKGLSSEQIAEKSGIPIETVISFIKEKATNCG